MSCVESTSIDEKICIAIDFGPYEVDCDTATSLAPKLSTETGVVETQSDTDDVTVEDIDFHEQTLISPNSSSGCKASIHGNSSGHLFHLLGLIL